MNKYTVVLLFTQRSQAAVTVEAVDEKAAYRKGMAVNPLSIKEWRPLKGYTDVVRIRQVNESAPVKKPRRKSVGRGG
ncbi:MAG: hypothetical protein PHV34_08870 [Verrucomicrobiae bacterium]|nr:hypothetical protein [Verrucomicrobiae bacterium]